MVTVLIAALLASVPQLDAPKRSESLLPAMDAPDAALDAPLDPSRSVYRVRWGIDLPVSAVGGAVGLARLLLTDQLVRKSCPCDPSTLNALDRSAVGNHSSVAGVVGDVTLITVLVVPPLLDLIDLGPSRELLEDLMVYAEALAVDTGVEAATVVAVARPRPITYAGNANLIAHGEGYVSFYAGHVSTAFAALAVTSATLRLRYGEHVWPWIVTLLVGASVGVDRVLYGWHFPTDAIAGGVAGLAFGIGVPWLHARGSFVNVHVVPSQGGLALAGGF